MTTTASTGQPALRQTQLLHMATTTGVAGYCCGSPDGEHSRNHWREGKEGVFTPGRCQVYEQTPVGTFTEGAHDATLRTHVPYNPSTPTRGGVGNR